jgi:hypothetical protein
MPVKYSTQMESKAVQEEKDNAWAEESHSKKVELGRIL